MRVHIAKISALIFAGIFMATMGLAQGKSSAGGKRTATIEVTNSTSATLVFSFVREANPGEFVVVTVASGATDKVQVPSGYVVMTVEAPYSDTGARYSAGSALSTGDSYEIIMTASLFGFDALADDDLAPPVLVQGEITPDQFYAICAEVNDAGRLWILYGGTLLSPSVSYEQVGSHLCERDGRSVYKVGDKLVYYECSQPFRDCVREESWDGRLGNLLETKTTSIEKRDREVEIYQFDWEVSASAPWLMRIIN